MNLILYIQITDFPEEVKYHNPIIPYITEQKPNTIIFDFDNHSDIPVINYASQLLIDSENTLLYIESNDNSSFSKLTPFLTKILDNPKEAKIILKGDNMRLEKMISILPHLKIQKNTYELEQIVPFFDKIF
jgi:hypothetical protein